MLTFEIVWRGVETVAIDEYESVQLATTRLKNRLWKVLRSYLLQEIVHYWPHQFINHAPSDKPKYRKRRQN